MMRHSMKKIAMSLIATIRHPEWLPIISCALTRILTRYRCPQPIASTITAPSHFPEKWAPPATLNALQRIQSPVYVDGRNIRIWALVEDHCNAIRSTGARGERVKPITWAETTRKPNLETVETSCSLLHELSPNDPAVPIVRCGPGNLTQNTPGKFVERTWPISRGPFNHLHPYKLILTTRERRRCHTIGKLTSTVATINSVVSEFTYYGDIGI
jgi:hypothetical protein